MFLPCSQYAGYALDIFRQFCIGFESDMYITGMLALHVDYPVPLGEVVWFCGCARFKLLDVSCWIDSILRFPDSMYEARTSTRWHNQLLTLFFHAI